ncbi:MAG TPA: hypothetical protein VK395_18360 [Gemmataceae bacterium]|nr:hypothetical protein [Gemmataceae bacterium]
MIGELNKIFDRDFVIGYFMPALAFLAATIGILALYGMLPTWLSFSQTDALKETTFIALFSWIGGVTLMALNREIFRLMEGYWYLRSYIPLTHLERWRFRRLHGKVSNLQAQYQQWPGDAASFPHVEKLIELKREAAYRFPSEEGLILPSSFGNTVRAFEDYPREVYGFESIQGWFRLLAVVSKDYRELVNSARATTDFWVNLWFASLLLLAEYAAIALWQWESKVPWLVVVCPLVAMFAYWRARSSAERWGEWVKASFDVFLPELCKKLGLALPPTWDKQRELWHSFSQAMIYRDAGSRARLTAFLEKPHHDSSDGKAPAQVPAAPPVINQAISVSIQSDD